MMTILVTDLWWVVLPANSQKQQLHGGDDLDLDESNPMHNGQQIVWVMNVTNSLIMDQARLTEYWLSLMVAAATSANSIDKFNNSIAVMETWFFFKSVKFVICWRSLTVLSSWRLLLLAFNGMIGCLVAFLSYRLWACKGLVRYDFISWDNGWCEEHWYC